MTETDEESLKNSILTEEGKLRHENHFLKERINNLEIFKKNFFSLQNDIIDARERLSIYEEALNFCQIKDKLIKSHENPVDDAGIEQIDVVIDFLHDSISASSYQDLVMSIFQSTDGLDLNISVQIANQDGVLDYALDESKKDTNINLINQHKADGEIIESKDYIIINHSYLSLIAGNLPDTESIKGTQIREFIKIISLGANARISSLSKKTELETLKNNIYKIFKKTNESFCNIQDNMDSQAITISELFLSFEKNLMDTLNRTTISESHSGLIKLILHDVKNELNLTLTSSLTMDEQFVSVMKKLENAYSPERDNE